MEPPAQHIKELIAQGTRRRGRLIKTLDEMVRKDMLNFGVAETWPQMRLIGKAQLTKATPK